MLSTASSPRRSAASPKMAPIAEDAAVTITATTTMTAEQPTLSPPLMVITPLDTVLDSDAAIRSSEFSPLPVKRPAATPTVTLSMFSHSAIMEPMKLTANGLEPASLARNLRNRSIAEIKAGKLPIRKFFALPSPTKLSSARHPQQCSHYYPHGSLHSALHSLSWPDLASSNKPVKEREAFLQSLPAEQQDDFRLSHVKSLRAHCIAVNQLLDHLAQIVQHPWQVALHVVDLHSEDFRALITPSHSQCNLTSVVCPLLYQLGFVRASAQSFQLVLPLSALKARIEGARSAVNCELSALPVADDGSGSEEEECEYSHNETGSFDVLTLNHSDDDSQHMEDNSRLQYDNESGDEAEHSLSHLQYLRSRSASRSIRSMPTKPTTVRHSRDTFRPSKTAGKPRLSAGSKSYDSDRPWPVPLINDVGGVKRVNPIELPLSFIAPAEAVANERYLLAETSGQTRPMIKTSSTVSTLTHTITDSFTVLELKPSNIEFGLIETGAIYRAQLLLTNTGNVKGRFAVRQPEPSPSFALRVFYRPGPLSAGLSKKLEVELECRTPCELVTEIEVVTESSIIKLPIHAQSLTSEDYHQSMSDSWYLPQLRNPTVLSPGFTRPSAQLPGSLKKIRSNIGGIRRVASQSKPSTVNEPETKEQASER